MATIQPTVSEFEGSGVQRVTWVGLATGDDGAPVTYPAYADRAVQVNGTFGGGTVTMQGSMDAGPTPTNWNTLTDPQGNDIALTAAKIEMIEEPTFWVRPVVTGGAASAMNITMLLRRK